MALVAEFHPPATFSPSADKSTLPVSGRHNIFTLPVHAQTLFFKSYLQIRRAVLHKEGGFMALELTFPPSRNVSTLHRQKHPLSSRTNPLI